MVADGRPTDVQLIGVRTGASGDAERDSISWTAGEPLDRCAIAWLDRDDPVTILYTSGTTGRPKGALVTNRSHDRQPLEHGVRRRSRVDHRRTSARSGPPDGHASRRSRCSTSAAWRRSSGVRSAARRSCSCASGTSTEGMRLAVQERVTGLGGVPLIARQILEHAAGELVDLDIRTFPMGGAAVPPDLPVRALEVLGDDRPAPERLRPDRDDVGGRHERRHRVRGATRQRRSAEPDRRPSCHRRRRRRARRRRDRRALLPIAAGRARGTGTTRCRRGRRSTTAGSTPATSGYVDADGFVYVVDRIKDVVIRGGENVYCAEVEAVLHDHPDVVDVAIVGIARARHGRARVRGRRGSPRRRHHARRRCVRSPRTASQDSSVRRRCTSPTNCRRPRRPRSRRTSCATSSPTREHPSNACGDSPPRRSRQFIVA